MPVQSLPPERVPVLLTPGTAKSGQFRRALKPEQLGRDLLVPLSNLALYRTARRLQSAARRSLENTMCWQRTGRRRDQTVCQSSSKPHPFAMTILVKELAKLSKNLTRGLHRSRSKPFPSIAKNTASESVVPTREGYSWSGIIRST